MALFPFFSNKKQPVLVRCTYCYDEFYLSPREVRLLETQNIADPVCPVNEECDMCHIGFMIPVNYTNNLGKTYLFHEMKPKIKTLTLIPSWNVYSVTVSKTLKFLNIKLGLRRQHITHETLENTRNKFSYFRVFSWASLNFLNMNLTPSGGLNLTNSNYTFFKPEGVKEIYYYFHNFCRPSWAKEKVVTLPGNSNLQGIVCPKGLSSAGVMGILNFLT